VDKDRSIQLSLSSTTSKLPSSSSLLNNLSSSIANSDELNELYELSQKAGFDIEPEIFKVLVDLLKLNVTPASLSRSLQKIIVNNNSKKLHNGSTTQASTPYSFLSSITTPQK
jgi:hypothetical protein